MTSSAPLEAPRDTLLRRLLERLRWSSRLDGSDLEVEVDDAVVRLKGTAPSLSAARAAVELAHGVPGVRAVADDIDVTIPHAHQCDDLALAKEALRVLEDEAHVDDDVRVSVTDGIVQLDGTVESSAVHYDAVRGVLGIPGVRGLANGLIVKPQDGKPAELGRRISSLRTRRMGSGP